MVIFSRLGKKGNLGNQLFQIASTIGIAVNNHQDYGFPKWDFSKYFKKDFPEINYSLNYTEIRESSFNFNEINLNHPFVDLHGWFQTEKYFNRVNIQEIFDFKEKHRDRIYNRFGELIQKQPIIISIRRGDFVGHKKYFQLDYWYYFSALVSNYRDWKNRPIIFFSDDLSYCIRHFGWLSNATFLKNLSPIDQLIFATFMKDFIISNSTFSWWLAYLSKSDKKKVFRPERNISFQFSKELDDSDYFPENWSIHSPPKKLIIPKFYPIVILGEFFKFIETLKLKTIAIRYHFKTTLKQAVKF